MGSIIKRSIDLINDLQFNNEGTELWLTSKDSYLTVITSDKWQITKNVTPEILPIKQLHVLSVGLYQSILNQASLKNLFIGLTNNEQIVFLTEKSSESTINVMPINVWDCVAPKRLSCSPDNNILAVILCDGTLKLYSIEFLLQQTFQTLPPKSTLMDQTCSTIAEQFKIFDTKVSHKSINLTSKKGC